MPSTRIPSSIPALLAIPRALNRWQSTHFYRQWRTPIIVGSLALGWMIVYVDRAILLPLLPVISSDFDLSGTQQGAIASSYFLIYVSMQVPWGILGDRIGLKKIILVMYLLIGLAMASIGLLAVNYLFLLLLVSLHGFGAGAYYSCSYGITVTTVPGKMRGLSAAVVTGGMALGFAIGLSVAGTLFRLTESWQGPFLILVVPTLGMIPVVWLALPTAAGKVSSASGGLAKLLRNRDVMTLNGAAFCSLLGYWVVAAWGPTFFHERLGLDITQAGLYTAIVPLMTLLGAPFWGVLSDRIGRKRITLAMFLLAGFAIALLPSAETGWRLFLVLGCYGFFGALAWNPVLVAWMGDHAQRLNQVGIGTVMGLMNTMGMSASFVAPVLSGWIRDGLGSLDWAFYLGAAACLGGFFCSLVARESMKLK